jgi:mannosyltransferase
MTDEIQKSHEISGANGFTLTSIRTHYALLAAVIVLGALLRLYELNFQSLWFDELHSVVPTHPETSIPEIIEYSKTDQPPVFFILLHLVFKIFGYSAETARLACAAIGILGIPVIYLTALQFTGRNTSLFAAALLSVNYFHIYYSQEVRFYGLVFVLSCLSYLFFASAFKTGRFRGYAWYTLTTVLLLYTHYFGIAVFGSQVITFFALRILKKDKSSMRAAVVSGTIIVATFLPWMSVIFTDFAMSSFWVKPLSALFLLDYFYYYFGKDVLSTAVLAILIGFFVKRVMHDRAQRDFHAILLLWIVLGYMIPALKQLLGPPILNVRYTMIVIPAWLIVIAIGWGTIQKKHIRMIIAGALIVFATINLFVFRKHYTKVQKQQIRELSAMVMADRSVPIVSAYSWHLNFYFRDEPRKVEYLVTDNLPDRFWLLQLEFFDKAEMEKELGSLSGDFDVVKTQDFFKVRGVLLARK